jgi:hypothetical protein
MVVGILLEYACVLWDKSIPVWFHRAVDKYFEGAAEKGDQVSIVAWICSPSI